MDKYLVLKHVSVLYVEDDREIADATSEYLKEFCTNVYVAYNGKDGLELYRSKNPDIIITDIAMPIMDGLKMSEIIRENDCDIPILINSAFSDISLFTRAIDIGIDDYILKPTDADKLIESIYKNSKYAFTDRVLKSHRKLMQSILDEIENPIFLIELDHKISLLNKSAKDMINGNVCFESTSTVDILNDVMKKNKDINKDFERVFSKAIEEKKSYKTSYICQDKNDENHYFDINLKPIVDVDGSVSFILKTMHDVTSHKKLEENLYKQSEKLEHLATHDILTSLPNRASLMESLKYEINHSDKFTLMFIDLDNFKYVNDTYGHGVGDVLLIDASKRIKNILKEIDEVARLGGDEFCVILKNLSDSDIVSKISKKINSVLSKEFCIENHRIYSPCSIGISIYPNDGINSKELLKNADTAMYNAKMNGRNSFCFYEKSMNEHNEKRLKLEVELRDAIINKEFEVYFQPQIDSINNKIIGFEALVRWNHPTLGLLSPDKFLPLARSMKILNTIDEYVMHNAIKSLIDFKQITDTKFTISINISANKLYTEDFVDKFKNVLDKYLCKAQWVELEITEDELITDIGKVTPVLKELEKLGVKIAIDDFGTGYSSLKYLKDLSVDRLKIDKSFIDDIDKSNSSLIVKAIIALGNSLELSVIAEGVEEDRQKLYLIDNGCHEIQGYLYSKPLSKEKAIDFIKKMDKKDA